MIGISHRRCSMKAWINFAKKFLKREFYENVSEAVSLQWAHSGRGIKGGEWSSERKDRRKAIVLVHGRNRKQEMRNESDEHLDK